MSLSLLPLEVTDIIVDHFDEDFATLRALAATARNFRERSQRILFHDITVTYGSKTGMGWVRPILADERIAGFVQNLTFTGNGASATGSAYSLLCQSEDWCRLRSLTLERIEIPQVVFESICGIASERPLILSISRCNWIEETYETSSPLLITSLHYRPHCTRYLGPLIDHPHALSTLVQASSASLERISLLGNVHESAISKLPTIKLPYIKTLISGVKPPSVQAKYIHDMLSSHPTITTLEDEDIDAQECQPFPPHAGPLLSSITGRIELIEALVAHRPVEHVKILRPWNASALHLSSRLLPHLIKSKKSIRTLFTRGVYAYTMADLRQTMEENPELEEFQFSALQEVGHLSSTQCTAY